MREARDENRRLRKKLEQGHDPKVVRLVEKQTIADEHSLEGMFNLWYETYCKDNKKNHFEIKRAFELSGESEYVFTNRDSQEVMGRGVPLPLPYNIMQWLRRHHKYEMEHWSIHDLRKTARSNFSTLTEFHIAEIMLGHSPGGHVQTYDHHDYLEEQAKAYTAWCKRLFGVVGLKSPTTPANSNVIRLFTRREA